MRILILTVFLLLAPLPSLFAQSIFVVTDPEFGAVGDGVADDAPAIQAAIDAATPDGGIVVIPAGTFRLGSGLTLKSGVTLEGVGWQGGSSVASRKGSWIYINSTDFVPITTRGNGMRIAKLAFAHLQPIYDGPFWQPSEYPFTIEIAGPTAINIQLRDLLLLNPTRGIRQLSTGNEAAGGLNFEGIVGQPFKVGIELQRVLGFSRFQDVRFGAVWYDDSYVLEYMENNLDAIVSYRADHPTFHGISIEHARTGLALREDGQGGKTARLKVSNLDCNLCRTAIDVSADGVNGKFSNVDFVSRVPNPQSPRPQQRTTIGIAVNASGVKLLFSGVHLSGADLAGIVVDGDFSTVMVDGLWIESWNQAGQGRHALEANHINSTILVGFTRRFDGPSGLIRNDPDRVLFDQ